MQIDLSGGIKPTMLSKQASKSRMATSPILAAMDMTSVPFRKLLADAPASSFKVLAVAADVFLRRRDVAGLVMKGRPVVERRIVAWAIR